MVAWRGGLGGAPPPRRSPPPRPGGGGGGARGPPPAAALRPRLRRGGGFLACSRSGGGCSSRRAVERRAGVRRRLVAECARHAAGGGAAASARLAGPLAAHCSGGSLVRAVGFGYVLAHGEIHVRRHLRQHVVHTGDRGEDGLDAFDEALLDFAPELELARVDADAAAVLRAQQIAALVDHGDVLHRQVGNAARHQMHDRADLGSVQAAARMQAQQHRRARFLLLAHERRWFGERKVYARSVDRRERLDRAREFAFERALVVDLLLELGGAELLRLHHFEADETALGQALAGEAQAHLVHLVRRNQQGPAAFGELECDVHLLQRADDRAAVAVGQVGVEHPVVRGLTPHPPARQQGDHGGERYQQTEFLLQGDHAQHLDARCRNSRSAYRHDVAPAATPAPGNVCVRFMLIAFAVSVLFSRTEAIMRIARRVNAAIRGHLPALIAGRCGFPRC